MFTYCTLLTLYITYKIKRRRTEIENQTTKWMTMYFSCQEREKKTKTNYQLRRFHHHTPTRAAPRGRGDNCVSSKTTDVQIWPPGGVTCVT